MCRNPLLTMVDHVGDSGPYGIIMDDNHVGDYGFSTLLSTPQHTVSDTCSTPFSSTISPNDHIQYPIDEEILQLSSLMELYGFDSILSAHMVGIHDHGYPQESEGSFPSQNLSSEVEDAWSPTLSKKSELSSIQPSLTLPQDMETDNQVSLPHPLMDCYLETEISKEGCSLSKNVLMEVSEVLRGCERSYQARIEGQNDNELVLEWKGTQLLRVSIWKT